MDPKASKKQERKARLARRTHEADESEMDPKASKKQERRARRIHKSNEQENSEVVAAGAYRVSPGEVIECDTHEVGQSSSDGNRYDTNSDEYDTDCYDSEEQDKVSVVGADTADDEEAPIVAKLAPDDAELSERVINELRAEMEENVQRQIEDRLMVHQSQQVIVKAVKVDDAEDEARNNISKRCICVTSAFVIIAVAIIVAVVMATKGNGDKLTPVSPSSSSPSTSPPTNEATSTSSLLSSRFESLFVALRPFLLKNLTHDEGTNQDDFMLYGIDSLSDDQFMTLDWLANLDEAQVTVKGSNDEGHLELELELVIERFVIALLFFATGGDRWRSPLAFLGPGSVCTWNSQNDGIVCEGQTVRKILLEQNGLVGTLPSELALLTDLQAIQMDFNSLFGSFPSEIYTLSNLQLLWLRGSTLTGELFSGVTQMSSLQRVDFNDNNFSGTLPSEVALLTNLQEISIRYNKLSGTIPTELGLLDRIWKLDFEGSNFTGTIPSELGSLPALLDLFLEENKLTGTLPTELGFVTSLERFYVFQNQLTGTVPKEYATLTALKEFVLHDNDLTGDWRDGFCYNISNFTDLEHLVADCEVVCSCCTECF